MRSLGIVVPLLRARPPTSGAEGADAFQRSGKQSQTEASEETARHPTHCNELARRPHRVQWCLGRGDHPDIAGRQI